MVCEAQDVQEKTRDAPFMLLNQDDAQATSVERSFLWSSLHIKCSITHLRIRNPRCYKRRTATMLIFLKKLDMKTSNAWHDDPYKDVPAWLTENCEWIKPKTFYHQAMQKNSDWSPAFQCINASVKCLIIWCHYYLGWKQVTLKFQFITMEA